jgi:hypothetical protein
MLVWNLVLGAFPSIEACKPPQEAAIMWRRPGRMESTVGGETSLRFGSVVQGM